MPSCFYGTAHLLVLIPHRKLRLSNKKVQDELVNVSGGLEFLQAVGFQLVFDEADGYSPPASVGQFSAEPSTVTNLPDSQTTRSGLLQSWV